MAVQNVKWKAANIQTDDNNIFINKREQTLLLLLGYFGGGNVSNKILIPAGPIEDIIPTLSSDGNLYTNAELNAAYCEEEVTIDDVLDSDCTNMLKSFGYVLNKSGYYDKSSGNIIFTETISDTFKEDEYVYDNAPIKITAIMSESFSLDADDAMDKYTPLCVNGGYEQSAIPNLTLPILGLFGSDVNNFTFPGYYTIMVADYDYSSLPDDIQVTSSNIDVVCFALEVINCGVKGFPSSKFSISGVKQIIHAFDADDKDFRKIKLDQDIVEYIRFGRPIDESLRTPDLEHFSMTAAGNMEWGDWHKITYKI